MGFKRKHAMLALAILQCFSSSGLLFGWAALWPLLTAPVEDGGAGLKGGYVHSLFVMCTAVNFASPLLLGVVLDLMGPRACSASSLALVSAGLYVFGLGSPEG